MKSDGVYPVAIIGGGYSGTILAAQLARRGTAALLIDGSGAIGRGVAYSTTDGAHLLNVRAEAMSAWAGEPDDFARYLAASGGGDRRDFAERRLFGRYLGEILDAAVASGATDVAQATATSAERVDGAWRITLDNGQTVRAQALALALGNQAPEPLKAFADTGDRFITNPWGPEARSAVADLAHSGEPALLVGTGLTMVDVVLSLDSAGHRGPILALSRRGLIPRGHADFEPAPVALDALPAGDLAALFRWLRRRSATTGWRAAIEGLRPHSQALWQGLPLEQQHRFLRHARPWWDVHRHRIAPQVAQLLAQMIGEGRLSVAAGRILSASASGPALQVDYRRRGAQSAQSARFAYAFNCTGPLHAIMHSRDSLLRGLLETGEIAPDQLGIGVDVDRQSRAGKRLWALGPLTKGRYWEIVAVPDIREQAAAVADDIQLELGA
ncbi:MAG: FAD/NAD(P)-binding protein [Sphingomicrobium sp.]